MFLVYDMLLCGLKLITGRKWFCFLMSRICVDKQLPLKKVFEFCPDFMEIQNDQVLCLLFHFFQIRVAIM